MHYLRADVIEEAVYRELLEDVLLPEKLLQILRDARPDEETRHALEHDASRLEADPVDVEQALRWLRLGISFILVWLGIVQFALITQGGELVTRSRRGDSQ